MCFFFGGLIILIEIVSGFWFLFEMASGVWVPSPETQ
jgi:hypothetical protein